jgi:flagellar protein FliO/FliZ
MEYETYIRFALVLLFVLGLVVALGWVLKRYGIGGGAMIGRNRRLGVVETALLGPKHRLVLVRRDAVEHLVLIGPTSGTVIESGIAGAAAAMPGNPSPRDSFNAMVAAEAARPDAAISGEPSA